MPMTEFHYEPLSYLDASFLALETKTSHMHVAGVALLDAAPLKGEDGGIDIARIRAHVESKLRYIPRYRQRLDWVPFDRRPVWVDDEHFSIDYHLRHSSLPRPGTREPSSNSSPGRIVSTPLDRSKPLWELWVVEGLDDDRFALIAKIHHCMIDGISGVDLTTILLNVVPSSEVEEPEVWVPRPAPTPTQLSVAELARFTGGLVDRLSHLSEAVRDGVLLTDRTLDKSAAAFSSLRSGWLRAADRTPLNPDIGPKPAVRLDGYASRRHQGSQEQAGWLGQRRRPRHHGRRGATVPHRRARLRRQRRRVQGR